MNNNRQSNNRRRGRNNSNNNRPNNNNRNGFDNQNRIDNRARGNASQMLEKYKKLAADAQHNDDRVNAEYYLQFADHYFRVLADSKARQDERQEGQQNSRAQNRDDDQNGGADELYNMEARGEPSADIGDAYDGGQDGHDIDNGGPVQAIQQRGERHGRSDASRRERNPLHRDQEAGAPPEPRNDSERPQPRRNAGRARASNKPIRSDEPLGLDASILPPSISLSDNADIAPSDKLARKPRARKPKANDEVAVAAAE